MVTIHNAIGSFKPVQRIIVLAICYFATLPTSKMRDSQAEVVTNFAQPNLGLELLNSERQLYMPPGFMNNASESQNLGFCQNLA
jgi:hypothetical protein